MQTWDNGGKNGGPEATRSLALAASLLAESSRLRLFVAIGRRLDPILFEQTLPVHIRWMIDQEHLGRLFLGGPVTPAGGQRTFDSLILVNAASLEEAQAFVAEDPLVRAGAATVELLEWTAFEGRISVALTLSNSRGALVRPAVPDPAGIAVEPTQSEHRRIIPD